MGEAGVSLDDLVLNGTSRSGIRDEKRISSPSPNNGRNKNGIRAPHAEPDMLEK